MVYQMCVQGALIVGSYANYLLGEDITPGDFDLLVPLEKWQTLAWLIPQTAKPNNFGGWRFQVPHEGQDVTVDVWPGTVVDYLVQCRSKHGTVYVLDYINRRVFSTQQVSLRF